ncbi:hypothetical protein [Streptomyces sp. NPDC050428]|uniref:hypothetical protein n=1 Tax=Streptomyces sp. NPDC050428 TaxID=3155757 RepID=UPI00341C58D4
MPLVQHPLPGGDPLLVRLPPAPPLLGGPPLRGVPRAVGTVTDTTTMNTPARMREIQPTVIIPSTAMANTTPTIWPALNRRELRSSRRASSGKYGSTHTGGFPASGCATTPPGTTNSHPHRSPPPNNPSTRPRIKASDYLTTRGDEDRNN